jgi:hypothetical protein
MSAEKKYIAHCDVNNVVESLQHRTKTKENHNNKYNNNNNNNRSVKVPATVT